ncbi:MAG: AraC family transcriptional regulator [Oscillospiraceae bacterium]|jgi:AraC-like DNA-binding protein|nr:AraC family transcriptional regulator [Oscillospiraceae bacterium]
MNWIESLTKAIDYIEQHLTDAIDADELSRQVYSSSAHFQLIFHIVMGLTVGEYIRNRRLSLAAQDLLRSGEKIKDIAARYQYDSQEGFSKAFTRFHGIPPSKASQDNVKFFHPLTINISIQGGFIMAKTNRFMDDFYWNDMDAGKYAKLSPAKKHQRIVTWALKARGQNPLVFDSVSAWILDDAEWTADKLAENEQILLHGVLARFKEQNAKLRTWLKELEPSGVVNAAVFTALDRFDRELSGDLRDAGPTADVSLKAVVGQMFTRFSVMRERDTRRLIAGNQTGAFGTDNQGFVGYINFLENSDAAVQWALFMPGVVAKQQKRFSVASFEYRKMPAMRFIGQESEWNKKKKRPFLDRDATFRTLDTLSNYKSGFDYDVCFTHHYGKDVDIERNHDFWGRFFQADTPVPEGFVHFDFVPESDDKAGAPYLSQFAFAVFKGNMKAMHASRGYDLNAMYDVTRNIMLGQGVNIPYPAKYWTAEVFLDGYGNWSTALMFSADLEN